MFLDGKRRTRTASPAQDLPGPVGVPTGISVGADRSHILVPTEQERSSAGEGSRTPAIGWRLAVCMMVLFALGTCNFFIASHLAEK